MAVLAIGSAQCRASEPPETSAPTASAEVRKPPPNPQARPYRERFMELIEARYPKLVTNPVDGTPLVTVLLDLYGGILRTDLEISSRPAEELGASEESFFRFGLREGELQYVGAASIQTPANTVLVVFGGTGTRELDRKLVQHFFPQVFSGGLPLNEGIWILFDHEGKVVRTGEERFRPGHLRELLEQRYAGIKTSDVTTTPVVGPDGVPVKDAQGHSLQLTCVWLAGGSPLPGS